MQLLLDKLVENGVVEASQIEKAKTVASQRNDDVLKVLTEILPEKETQILIESSLFCKIPYLELSYIDPTKEAIYLLSEDLARKNNILPLFKIKKWFFVGFLFPIDYGVVSEVRRFTGLNIKPCFITRSEMQSGIDKIYRAVSSAEKIVQKIGEIGDDIGDSVIQIINLLVAQAVRDRASDIHIEPEPDKLRIRFRIDGILYEVPSPPKSLEMAMISRIKVMSDLDIAESRIPQDGHFKVMVDAKDVDVRVSTLPTVNGENVVLRILDTSNVLLGLEKLGFFTDSLNMFKQTIAHPYGMVLTTGPTGSGKTTTLYSALMELNTIDKHIVTIEDPVEYRLPLIRQVQINPKSGLTFSSGLRSILRHDPDIIMVGEIRDLETANIAVQSALTGHLVFSTLHTNDAPSAVTRLHNMGLEPFLISASLITVMAQRLARQICPECKKSYPATKSVIERFHLQKYGKKIDLYKGVGCDSCKGTGYQGRVGLFEIMLIDDELREMIVAESSVVALKEAARKKGMKTLFEDGVDKVLKGMITLDEVSRVCEEKVEFMGQGLIEEAEPTSLVTEEIESKITSVEKINLAKEELETYNKKINGWAPKENKKDKKETQ
ncbi:MAG: ATPase, T2SS/T4P/T4SS family [Candidatus Saelkia tenebricola]|nr:ATPase, T2SS/T4P/T4SS family [Candidatus Saelkia tenebricola]